MDPRKFFSKQQKEVKAFFASLCFHTCLLLVMACVFYTKNVIQYIPIKISFHQEDVDIREIEDIGAVKLPSLENASLSLPTKNIKPEPVSYQPDDIDILVDQPSAIEISQNNKESLFDINSDTLYQELKRLPKQNKEHFEEKTETQQASTVLSELIASFAQNTNTADTFTPNGSLGNGAESIEQRLYFAGAKTGDIQISLAWNTVDDIDLWVGYSPNNIRIDYINFMNRVSQLSGGMLDIDMNAHMFGLRHNPVENIFWAKNRTPQGFYDVRVHFFRSWSGNMSVPVVVRVKILEEVKEYKVVCRAGNPPEKVVSFIFPSKPSQ